MNQIETANLLTFIGFIGFAVVVGALLMRSLVRDSIDADKRYHIGLGVMVAIFAANSAISALAAPPFTLLSPYDAALLRSLIVWGGFLWAGGVAIGGFRRH